MKHTINWWEHPQINELDEWVEDNLPELRDKYLDTFTGCCVADFKTELGRWVNNLKSDLDTLVDMLDEFKDDQYQDFYEVEISE